jgi:D-3-phosphoglycerate dehydrogenase
VYDGTVAKKVGITMYRVLIRDQMAPIAKDILEATGQIEVDVNNEKAYNDPERLAEIIHDYHGLAIRSGTRVNDIVLQKASQLKAIGRAGIGVDNIDIAGASRRGIVVMNAPGGNTVTTAEHTISLMMALARNIPQATASLREGQWEKKKLLGIEIAGKTIGIIGLGQIGRIVAERARGLKMKVIVSDPFISKEAAQNLDAELVSLEELYGRSDFITLHVPRLPETIQMINQTTLDLMKPGARLINCSRGEMVNLDDLARAIENSKIAGAALDVFPEEPPQFDHPIFKDPRVIFTPHLGASTSEAQTKVAEMIAHQLADYLVNGVIHNAVNFPSVSEEVMAQLRPYLALCEKMGTFMGQLVHHKANVSIHYSGEVTDLDTRPLTHAVLKGFLSAFSDAPINFVSAPIVAEEKGIQIKETISRKEKRAFSSLIRVQIEGDQEGPNEIWGTIFEREYPRIVRLGQIYMDAIPEGYLIIIQNYDQPGVIGNVGTLLGKHNINIGQFHLGRRDSRALCIVNVDSCVDEDVLQDIQKLPNIISAQQVFLA